MIVPLLKLKIIFLLIFSLLHVSSHALTGKKEFWIETDDRVIKIIHYFDSMIVLSESKKPTAVNGGKTCEVYPLKGYQFIGEEKEIYFFDEQAYVKSSKGLTKYKYQNKKTEMFFYKELCKIN